jgi:hypothetical protein
VADKYVLVGTNQIGGVGDPLHGNWNPGDTLKAPDGTIIGGVVIPPAGILAEYANALNGTVPAAGISWVYPMPAGANGILINARIVGGGGTLWAVGPGGVWIRRTAAGWAAFSAARAESRIKFQGTVTGLGGSAVVNGILPFTFCWGAVSTGVLRDASFQVTALNAGGIQLTLAPVPVGVVTNYVAASWNLAFIG